MKLKSIALTDDRFIRIQEQEENTHLTGQVI